MNINCLYLKKGLVVGEHIAECFVFVYDYVHVLDEGIAKGYAFI